MQEVEIWKDIVGYKGLYEVSTIGNVNSLHNGNTRKLKGSLNKKGYRQFTLRNAIGNKYNVYLVQQLVAIAFLNHKPCGMKLVVDHIDNNKLNNHVDNLQVITTRENTSKDRVGGTSKYVGVTWHKKLKKWRSMITINGKLRHLGLFVNEIDASNAYQNKLTTLR